MPENLVCTFSALSLSPAVNPSIESKNAIVSLSLNPAIDLTYEIDQLIQDQKSRSASTCYDPGGTGINVGRALEKLNANSHTCCVTAGKMGEFLRTMLKQELNNVFTLEIEGETRINTTIVQQSPQRQYEINAAGPAIPPRQLELIISRFLSLCGQGIGILTGTLPPGTPDSTYHRINTALKHQGGRCIIDAPVAILKKSLDSQPFLIKPNQHELETMLGKKLNSIEQIAHESRRIHEKGISYVCVSLAENGALLTGPDNSYYCPAPEINMRSSVGAGDSLVAGLAYAFSENKNIEQALQLAVCCGAGTAQQTGTQLFKQSELDMLIKQTSIKTLDI